MNRMSRAALQCSVNGDVLRALPAVEVPADAARRSLRCRPSALYQAAKKSYAPGGQHDGGQ